MDPLTVALVFLAGVLAGWKARSKWTPAEPKKPWDKRNKSTFDLVADSWLRQNDKHAIRFMNIDGDRALAVCARIEAGKPLTYRSMTGKGKLLTRTQFEVLRVELVKHQMAVVNRGRSLSPTPFGKQLAHDVLTRSRAAQAHKTKYPKNRNTRA